MRSLVALVIALAVAFGIYHFYLKRVQPAGPGTLPTQAISLTGVQNDLLAIAQAERAYFAQNGSYASLGELTASGALTITRTGRDGYTYSVETRADGFIAMARYSGPTGLRNPTLVVDQSMEVRRVD